MFVGTVNLNTGTRLELVIVPLKGSTLEGQWSLETDLLLLCVIQSCKSCTCRVQDTSVVFKKYWGSRQKMLSPLQNGLRER